MCSRTAHESGKQAVEPLLRVEQLDQHVVNDVLHRGFGAHVTDDLADRIGEEVLRPHALDARPALPPPEQRLQGRGQGRRRAGPVPRVGEAAAQRAAGLAGDAAREDRVVRAGFEHLLLDLGSDFALDRLQPDRAAPDALAAEREGRGHLAAPADSAGAEHRQRRDRVDDARPEHHRGRAAGVAARLGADCDDEVAARVLVPQRVLFRTGHRRDLDAPGVRTVDELARRRSERVDDQLDRMLERDVDHPRALLRREGELADHRLHDRVGVGRRERRDARFIEQVPDEVALRLREQPLGLELAIAERLVARRVEDVDAVGPAVDVLVDPLQLGVDALGAHPRHAEDAEPAGLGNRDDDVAAMREGKDRDLDPEHLAKTAVHARSWRARAKARICMSRGRSSHARRAGCSHAWTNHPHP